MDDYIISQALFPFYLELAETQNKGVNEAKRKQLEQEIKVRVGSSGGYIQVGIEGGVVSDLANTLGFDSIEVIEAGVIIGGPVEIIVRGIIGIEPVKLCLTRELLREHVDSIRECIL